MRSDRRARHLRRRWSCVLMICALGMALLCVSGCGAAKSETSRTVTTRNAPSHAAPGKSFAGTLDKFGSDGPKIEIILSGDGNSLLQLKVTYMSSFSWGENGAPASSASLEYLTHDQYRFAPSVIPVRGGSFSVSLDSYHMQYGCVEYVEGHVLSGTRVEGTIGIRRFDGTGAHRIGGFRWSATAG
jgi:hypothetical protein